MVLQERGIWWQWWWRLWLEEVSRDFGFGNTWADDDDGTMSRKIVRICRWLMSGMVEERERALHGLHSVLRERERERERGVVVVFIGGDGKLD